MFWAFFSKLLRFNAAVELSCLIMRGPEAYNARLGIPVDSIFASAIVLFDFCEFKNTICNIGLIINTLSNYN